MEINTNLSLNQKKENYRLSSEKMVVLCITVRVESYNPKSCIQRMLGCFFNFLLVPPNVIVQVFGYIKLRNV